MWRLESLLLLAAKSAVSGEGPRFLHSGSGRLAECKKSLSQVAVLKARGHPVHVTPSSIEALIANPDYAYAIWACIDVVLSSFDPKVEQVCVDVPGNVLRKIDVYFTRRVRNPATPSFRVPRSKRSQTVEQKKKWRPEGRRAINAEKQQTYCKFPHLSTAGSADAHFQPCDC